MSLLTMESASSERRRGGALTAIDAGYSDVEKLAQWVGKVDLTGNMLTSLDFLGGDVSCAKVGRNKITSLKGLGACTELKTLDVTENPLEDLSGVEEIKGLNVLVAARCSAIGTPSSIAAVTKLSQLHTLVLRDVPLNDVSLAPVCQMKTLTKLSLSNCCLKKLPWSSKPHRLTNLRELRISNNQLTALDTFMLGCSALKILDLGSNKLTNDCLKVIKGIKHLTHLTLKGNPFAEEDNYCDMVMSSCRGKLKYLDDGHATQDLEEKKKRKREAADLTRNPPKKKKEQEEVVEPVQSNTVRKNVILIAVKQDFTADYEEEDANLFQIKNPTTGSSRSERDSGLRVASSGKGKHQKVVQREVNAKVDSAVSFLLNQPSY
eukprot:TRINITY_DN24815_c0_g1_i1.p1 TRINITY_DN24815_c0_g1~~TRINITY_DN24815_c0_g1_i1.p1  ORF type:complete len:377 (+),score=73.96 TRINITY_DN24815_c0_g1_i1:35-1165(+)